MIKQLPVLTLLLLLINTTIHAQEINLQLSDSSFGSPSILGAPRPKGIVLRHERVENFGISSTSGNPAIGNGNADVNKNRRWELKFKIPVLNAQRLKIAAGIEYYLEEFRFISPGQLKYREYVELENKPLKSLTGVVYVIVPMKNRKYIAIRTSASLNGDYSPKEFANAKYLKISITPLIGWRKTAYFTYGFGINYGYAFGRRSFSPVFVYSRTFNHRWGVDAALPASFKLRRTSNNAKSILYGIIELNGANYTITVQDSVLKQYPVLSLQKSEVRTLITWEREIYDFLWFGVSGGVRGNIRFRMAEQDKFIIRSPDVVIINKMKPAPFFNVSLFFVPPKKMSKK